MDAFEALGIEETRRVADDECAIDRIARHGVPAAVRERLGTVPDQFAVFEDFLDVRVRLPFLKSGVRIELRIRVFEREDKTDGKTVVRKTVDPTAAVHVGSNGPPERVRDVSRFDAAGLDVPKFFDADAVALRVDVVEFLPGDEFFAERAARAFR